jgi:cytochrome c-type biogenesis protein CcmH
MYDLWIGVALLLLAALAFLFIPAWRGRARASVADRAAQNVQLYQERLTELSLQHAAGTLDASQLEAGKAEAARELLADNAQTQSRAAALGRKVPMLVALLLPIAGLALYLHWGGSDQVQLTRELGEPPRTVEEMVVRLERTLQVQPEDAESWFFLGRAYMAQNRVEEAAEAFAQAAEFSGRQPEVLGYWAQALYFSAAGEWTPQLQALTDEALQANPDETTTLGLLGIVAFEQARYNEAIAYWQRLLAATPAGDGTRQAIETGITRAREKLLELGEQPSETVAAPGPLLSVRIDLADAVRGQVQPEDSVFVFARAVDGPPMPLAVKRLTVADLPVQVNLSDADAMLPQMKISSFPKVQLVARISRSGDATDGEWLGLGQPISSSDSTLQQISIDTPDN